MNKSLLRREQFPVTDHLIYMNHAAVAPLPEVTYRAIEEHGREQRDFGALYWRDWEDAHQALRDSAARLLHCDSKEISILKNTSEGISFVAEGYRWKAGENVVSTDSEFPSNYVAWKRLERKGVALRLVPTVNGAFTVADVEKLIDEKTRVVAISWVAFHTGFVADLEAIGELCAARGIVLCVDAIQGVGALDLDVKKAKISFLSADGHKWMLGLEGTAIFYASADARDRIEIVESGWTNVKRGGSFIQCSTELFDDGRRFECGAVNTSGVYALGASLDLINNLGIAEIEREVVRLANKLATELETVGFTILSPRPILSGIVSAAPPAVNLEGLRDRVGEIPGPLESSRNDLALMHLYLEHEKIICAPRIGGLRFSPHFYNDENEIDDVVEVLRMVVG